MHQNDWTDHQLIEAIKSRDAQTANKALEVLFKDPKLRNTVRNEIFQLGGNEEDFREMLGIAVLKFDKRVRAGIYDPAQSAVRTHIVNLAKSQFRTNRRSDRRIFNLHQKASFEEPIADPEKELSRQEKHKLLERILAGLGPKCQMLLSYFSLGYSNTEIAEKMNYKTANVAKSESYECRRRLNNYLSERLEERAALWEWFQNAF